ncbi:hypothetical protein RKD45_006281 [Streptomyces griseus]
MSEWLVLTIAMASACAVVLTTAVLSNRRIADDDDPSQTPDVIEYMTMMIGVVYAIVLGLAIAGVWEGRSAAQESVRLEAQALHEVSARSAVYPVEVRDRIRKDVDAYVAHVVGAEWQSMTDDGNLTEEGTRLLDRVRADVTEYKPRTDHEGQAYQPLVDQVAAADDARGSRGQNAGATMPGVVWFGLITGAVVTVRADLHAPDPQNLPRTAAGRSLQRPDRVPALPDLGFRRPLRPGHLRDDGSVRRSVPTGHGRIGTPGPRRCRSPVRCAGRGTRLPHSPDTDSG